MIKQGILNGELGVDSHIHRDNGSCPLMPEEVQTELRFNFQVQTAQCMLLLSKLEFCFLRTAWIMFAKSFADFILILVLKLSFRRDFSFLDRRKYQ